PPTRRPRRATDGPAGRTRATPGDGPTRLCPTIPKGRLRRTISVRPELVEGRDQSQGERMGNPRKPSSIQAILGQFPLYRRRTNAPFDKLRANGKKRRFPLQDTPNRNCRAK